MDRPVPINVDLIAEITGLPTDGEKPEQYLEDKTKEKSISDEIKEKYGIERGNRGIRINDINDPVTRFATRLLGCKLMRKCRKEEVPAGVVAVAVQCTKGSSMSWAPYLLNSFLEDCKDAQDWGSEFHYSWLLILIALMGWQEPTYTMFLPRTGKCGATRYTSLRSTTDPKVKKFNNDMFTQYLTEIHNNLVDTWRISPETVQEFGQIANFQASRHNMWLQAKKDPTKEWLQLKYCVMMQDIHMEVQEWPEEWKVPEIPREMPTVQIQTQGSTVPAQQIGRNGTSQKKKTTIGTVGESNPIQKKRRTQKKSQRGPTQGPPGTEQAPRGPTGQVSAEEVQTEAQEVAMEEEVGKDTCMDTQMPEVSEPSDAQRKRPGEQASGTRKKEKAHRKPMETSLTTDDVELIATTVEDRLSEVWENMENHRASILEQVQEVKTALEQLRIRAEQKQKEKPSAH
jgi:hypothetical protein